MAVLDDLLEDLAAESGALDAVLAPLDAAAWRTPTPAGGWTVAHQIAHLAWTDRVAALAARDPDGFNAMLTRALQEDGATFVDQEAERGAQLEPAELLAALARRSGRTGRGARRGPARRQAALVRAADGGRDSMATARLMETWAHGQDVADALGVTRRADRTGSGTSPTSASAPATSPSVQRAAAGPDAEFRVELTAPDGSAVDLGPGRRARSA